MHNQYNQVLIVTSAEMATHLGVRDFVCSRGGLGVALGRWLWWVVLG